MDPKLKHLEFIQSVIGRMAGNSFLLKGWTVTLVAALFALAAKDANPRFAAVAYFAVVVFWVLDGYFLSDERAYRALYDKVRQTPPAAIDFSMDVQGFKSVPNGWGSAMVSTTLLLFYLPTIIIMFIVTFFLLRKT